MEFLERKIKKLVSWVHTPEINQLLSAIQSSFLGVHLLIMRVHCADTIILGKGVMFWVWGFVDARDPS